ncbi:hypothetical protein T190115A13A_160055 [Tenacibaculum sp. 190524A02b]|uniref:Uncharacterized protein n=1 Tax=Tenacibaculum vairaonense TaxID=3137860 RepID=A0ABM9PIS2_9FLAO
MYRSGIKHMRNTVTRGWKGKSWAVIFQRKMFDNMKCLDL